MKKMKSLKMISLAIGTLFMSLFFISCSGEPVSMEWFSQNWLGIVIVIIGIYEVIAGQYPSVKDNRLLTNLMFILTKIVEIIPNNARGGKKHKIIRKAQLK